jgi:uncharacterized 2Fe-2S/4Fe-4S cluster protein (DUF4445 family)
MLGASPVPAAMTDQPFTLTVHTDGVVTRLPVPSGLSVREVLDTTDLRVRAACGGTGSCGACTVRLLAGAANPFTLAEYMKLTAAERAQGLRLSCQLRLLGDAEILLDNPAPPSKWRSIPFQDLAPISEKLPELTGHIYGVAVDLGTTHIRVALWDRKHGQRIATRRGPNPQGVFGADVLNRLTAARASPERAREMAKLAHTAIIQAVRDMLARDVGEVTPMLAEIGEVVVVGNTAMLALLTESGGEALLDPDHWQRLIDCQPRDPVAWQARWYMPNARIRVLAPVAGFVGSDLAADLLATGLTDGPAGSLLLDVGTNTEIALWDGRTLHVTSVPGGPAFEGGGVCRGMRAEPGAIYRVRRIADGFACDVIGGGEARGFCGSGLTDAIAVLLAAGLLKASGRFAVPRAGEGYRLLPDNPATAIVGSDVDAFQRAKAATAAAMAVLLDRAGMVWSDLRRLCVCGAFGHTLDVGHACDLGLLPPLAAERVELYADASLTGCEKMLLTGNGEAPPAAALEQLTVVNMSLVIEYDDAFMNHLLLRPIPTD